ncbi:hypothetical protein THAOC_31621, partial [Thalassiosira oceanica]
MRWYLASECAASLQVPRSTWSTTGGRDRAGSSEENRGPDKQPRRLRSAQIMVHGAVGDGSGQRKELRRAGGTHYIGK